MKKSREERMTKKLLKNNELLAKYAGMIYYVMDNYTYLGLKPVNSFQKMTAKIWDPSKDWKQLKMLEEKMIKELNIYSFEVQLFTTINKTVVSYFYKDDANFSHSKVDSGKTEINAVYNAILKYAKEELK